MRDSRVVSLSRVATVFAVLSLLAVSAAPLLAQGDGPEGDGGEKKDPGAGTTEKKAPSYDLIAWGQLKPVKGQAGFFGLSYTRIEKRRRKKVTAFLKLGDDLKILQDIRIKPTKIQPGSKVYVLGKIRETSSISALGVETTEFFLTRVQAFLTGKGIKFNAEYRDPRDKELRWYTATVKESKSGVLVDIEGNSHRLQSDKATVFLQRSEGESEKIAKAKKTFYAFVLGNETDERPTSKRKSDEKKAAYETNRVIFLDPVAVKYGVYSKLYP